MMKSLIDTMIGAFSEGSSRRGLLQRLTGLTLAGSFLRLSLEEADSRKRKKKRRNKKRRGRGGNDGGGGGNDGGGGGGGGGGDDCPLAICEGQCVDLDTDPQNCGACGATCVDDVPCIGGRCAVAFGERGDSFFQFDGPRGLAFDGIGRSLMADENNQRVARFLNADFETFGEAGEEDGQFLRPRGVAVNAATGDIYVTDIQRHCIQRFSDTGVFEATFGSFGNGQQQLSFPNNVAIDQVSGNVYIINTGNDQIKELNANLLAPVDFGLINGPGSFNSPLGIAVDGDRNLVVADTGNNRVVVLQRDGNFVRVIGQAGSGNGEFDTPVAVAVDGAGDIFVVDQGNNRIQQFSADGQFRATFGRAGTGIGEFDAPFGIAIDDGVIGVVDTRNNRVQFFFPAERNAPAASGAEQRVKGASASRSDVARDRQGKHTKRQPHR